MKEFIVPVWENLTTHITRRDLFVAAALTGWLAGSTNKDYPSSKDRTLCCIDRAIVTADELMKTMESKLPSDDAPSP